MLKSFYDKGRNGTLPHLIQPAPVGDLNCRKRPAESSGDKPNARVVNFNDPWIPPGTPADDSSSNYAHQILGDLGYL